MCWLTHRKKIEWTCHGEWEKKISLYDWGVRNMKNTPSHSSKQHIFILGKSTCHGSKWGKLQRQVSEHCTSNEWILLLTRRLEGPRPRAQKHSCKHYKCTMFFGNTIVSVIGQFIVSNTNWWMIIWGHNYVHQPKLTNNHVLFTME